MRTPNRFALVAAFAALYVIWGSTYLFIRFAIDSVPPLLMAGSRYLTAGALLYTFSRWRGAVKPPPKTWRSAAIIGGLLLLGGNGGVTLSEQFVDTGLAAVVVATVPIYIVLLSWLVGDTARPSSPVLLGLAGGFIGVGILLAPSIHFSAGESKHALGIIILLIGSFLWSAGSVYSRRAPNSESPFLASGQQMLCGGALLLAAGFICREKFHPHLVTWLSAWSWLYLVLIGAIIGFSAYIFLLRHCAATKVATYAYVNPIVAVILGTLFAGETLSARTIVAAALILGSVALVITAEQWKSRTVTPNAPGLAEAE